MAKRHHDGHYEGHEHRRHEEMHDAGMIKENHSAVANLPQEVHYKPWGGGHEYLDGDLNDTIVGVNRQKNEDVSGTKRNLGVHKW